MERLHARRANDGLQEAARALIARISMVELSPIVLDRALAPFPIPGRTLDALHLATIVFLRGRRIDLPLATYDRRLGRDAEALDIKLVDLEQADR